MEQILNKLSEIELTAQRIMEDCDRQKQQLSEEAEQKCKNYDGGSRTGRWREQAAPPQGPSSRR